MLSALSFVELILHCLLLDPKMFINSTPKNILLILSFWAPEIEPTLPHFWSKKCINLLNKIKFNYSLDSKMTSSLKLIINKSMLSIKFLIWKTLLDLHLVTYLSSLLNYKSKGFWISNIVQLSLFNQLLFFASREQNCHS